MPLSQPRAPAAISLLSPCPPPLVPPARLLQRRLFLLTSHAAGRGWLLPSSSSLSPGGLCHHIEPRGCQEGCRGAAVPLARITSSGEADRGSGVRIHPALLQRGSVAGIPKRAHEKSNLAYIMPLSPLGSLVVF